MKKQNQTSIFHDIEEGDHDGGDWLEIGGGEPSPLRVNHLTQCFIQYPPPHFQCPLSDLSLSLSGKES